MIDSLNDAFASNDPLIVVGAFLFVFFVLAWGFIFTLFFLRLIMGDSDDV